MFSCEDAAGAIVQLADGDDALDPDARARLEIHLGTCAACREALDTQRTVAAWLQSRPSDRVSDAFAARLAPRLDEASGWLGLADWRVWTLRLTPVAALLAAVVLLAPAPAGTTVTLDEWALNTDASSPESLLLQPDVNADAIPDLILESFVTGEPAVGGGTNDAGK